MRAGSKCFVAGRHDLGCEILTMDQENGLLELKVGKQGSLPDSLCLIPNDFISAVPIKRAIGRYATAWEEGRVLSQAVDDLLRRQAPRVAGFKGGTLVEEGEGFLERVVALAQRLDRTTLCIQGPPGTGKTYTAAAIIAKLMKEGHKVGVTANSHKVILNLLAAVVHERKKTGGSGGIFKVEKSEGEEDEELVTSGAVALIDSKEIAASVTPGSLVSGTAWAFSRPEMEAKLDYLFIDEAGQFSLANAVAVGTSTRNLILVGDQMQLAQPTQGTHPGESGMSCLEYLLQDHQTVPPELGILLGKSYRMHQGVCGFISDAIYEGRLHSDASTAGHRVIRGKGASMVTAETGIVWVPVDHDGCEQSSDEEVEAIGAHRGRAAHSEGRGQEGRAETGDARRHPRRRALQHAGSRTQSSATRRREGGIGGSLPGPGGRGGDRLPLRLDHRGCPARRRVRAEPQPSQRRDLAGPGAGDRGGVARAGSARGVGRWRRCGW